MKTSRLPPLQRPAPAPSGLAPGAAAGLPADDGSSPEHPAAGARRRALAVPLAGPMASPLARMAALVTSIGLPFGLVRSRRIVVRDGWILGDRDR